LNWNNTALIDMYLCVKLYVVNTGFDSVHWWGGIWSQPPAGFSRVCEKLHLYGICTKPFYCKSLLAGVPQVILDRLQRVMNAAIAHVSDLMCNCLHWLRVPQRIQFKLCLLMYCIRHCMGWRQTTLESSVGLSARTMLAVLSGLWSVATSSFRERRQSSATEHSPSQVLWCGTVCQRQSEIPAPCQTSNLLWRLTCLFDYILEAAATITICIGALQSVYVLWHHRSHCRIIISSSYYYFYYYY